MATTAEEEKFIAYWEKRRLVLQTTSGKIMTGLPYALLFSVPIVGLMAVVFLFVPDWAAKFSYVSFSTMLMVIFAVIIITIFVAYFRSSFQYESNEQFYKELLNKRKSKP